jgi:hypothetical protein
MAKKNRKTKAVEVVDTKKLAANDVVVEETPLEKLIPASAVGKGIAYHKLAGSPSKQSVTACFGKTGYAYSWVKRAEVLGVSTEALCEEFKADPAAVKVLWEKATTKISK